VAWRLERAQAALRGVVQAGCLIKPCGAACALSKRHPKGRFCLPAAPRRAGSTGNQLAFAHAARICGQTEPVTPLLNRFEHPAA